MRSFSWSRHLSPLRHVDIIWSEESYFFFEVQSYLPDSGLCSGFPGELSSLHMEPFPWPKANECGPSPACAMETGRKDAQPGGLLMSLGIYSDEAWRGTSLPNLVEYPNPSARTSHAGSLTFPHVFKMHWGISWLKSKACTSPSSASCCYHPTLSTVPIVGSVNEQSTAVQKHQQFVPRSPGKGTRQEVLCFGLARGGLLHSSETLALLCKFPVALGGLQGVVWTPVAHGSFPHTV